MQKFKNKRQLYYQISKKYSQCGSTLVEAIVAIFIMSFGVLALMLAQINSVNISINAANQTAVANAVQNYAEQMRAKAKTSVNTKDVNNNSISYFYKDYSKFKTDDKTACASTLNIKLINSNVTDCKITDDGEITVKWSEESNSSASSASSATISDFSYTLKADQV